MVQLRNSVILAGLLSGVLACGQPTSQRKEIKGTSGVKVQEADAQANSDSPTDAEDSGSNNNVLSFETPDISESAFAEKTAEGEKIFTGSVMQEVMSGISENKPEPSSSMLGEAAQESQNQEPPENAQDDPGSESNEQADASGNEPVSDSSETMALAQSQIEEKIEGMLPAGSPSFMTDKLKKDATTLLYCSDSCEETAQKLLVTSYSVSRFLSSRGLSLAETDLNGAIAAAGKLLSDIALIVLEATAADPDPANIILLVDIFIADLQELILALI